MVSFKLSGLAAVAALVASVQADYYVVPDSVPESTRNKWCSDQQAACPLICLQEANTDMTTYANDCNPTDLSYSCICANGLAPNMSEYSLTLPYWTCTEWGVQCVKGCGSDNACASSCTQDHPCGALNPTRVNVTSTSSIATSTKTRAAPSSIPTDENGFPIDPEDLPAESETTPEPNSDEATETDASAQPSHTGAAALSFGNAYGLPVTFASMFALFAYLL